MSLMLGATGCGKTLILKRLETLQTPRNGSEYKFTDVPQTVSTVGTNLTTVSVSRRQEVTVRELGGAMGPIWKNYFKDVNSFMYVIDLSNRLQVAASCIQLLTVLSSKNLSKVPVLLIFNKIDMPDKMTKSEIESMFRLKDIIRCCERPVKMVDVSAVTGQGLVEIIKWLEQNSLGK